MFTTGPAFWKQINGAGGVIAYVPVGSMTLTGYAPTVFASNYQEALPPTGAMTLTGYAPTVMASDNKNVSVPTGAMTLTGYAPTITGCVYEYFSDFSNYYVATGSSSSFSINSGTYGNQINIAAQSVGFASIYRRDITSILVRNFHFRVRVTDTNTDDAGFITIRDVTSGHYLTFTPRRENPSYRAVFSINGAGGVQSLDFGATALTVNEYYDFDIAISASTLVYSLTKVSDSSLFGSGTATNNAGDIRVSALDFFNDSTGPTTTAEYLDIEICGEY